MRISIFACGSETHTLQYVHTLLVWWVGAGVVWGTEWSSICCLDQSSTVSRLLILNSHNLRH